MARLPSAPNRFPKGHNRGGKAASNGRKSNAIGYQKRQSLKGKLKANISDVYDYEYEAEKSKRARSKVTLDLSKDEAIGMGGDDEDDGLDDMRKRLKLGGLGDEDGVVASEDDEEIESDDAFDASDDEKFGHFKFASKKQAAPASQKKKKGTTQTARTVHFEVDLNEDNDSPSHSGHEEEDSGEEAEDTMMNLSELLDAGGAEPSDQESDEGSGSNDPEEDDSEGEEEEEEEEEEEDEEEEEALEVSSADEEDDEMALENLNSFIGGLDTSTAVKRKATDIEDDTNAKLSKPRKRRLLKERTEAGPEGEFSARLQTDGKKLQIEDFLKPLTEDGTTQSSLALNNSIKALKGSKGDALPAPLPQRLQDRLDREAAYEQTKEEVQKWAPTMKRIKEAEHLSFPLQAPPTAKTSTAELTAKFKPTTELESAVDKLLKAANLREQDIEKTEELKMQDLNPEEVAQRRAELRKMRDLMFRAEIKAKRVAKIKSKTYRKIQKKSREKQAEKLATLEGGEADEDAERMKAEVDRARERATLRHKNTGKWAKSLKGRELDVDQRKAILEMYDRGEKLKRKIAGVGSEDEDSSDEDDEDVEAIKARAFDELDATNAEEVEEPPEGKKKSSLFQLKFMQVAAARDARAAEEQIDSFREELTKLGADIERDPEAQSSTSAVPVTIEKIGNRTVYRPGPSKQSTLGSDYSGTETLKSSESQPPSAVTSIATLRETPPVPRPTEPNPWLTEAPATTKITRKKNEEVISKNSNAAQKSKNAMKKHAMKKHAKKSEEAREKEKEDAVVEIDMSNALTLNGVPSIVPAASITARVDRAFTEDDEGNREVEEQEQRMAGKGKGKAITAFEQRDLVARAFAGDNVVQEFAEEKRREIEADAPREEDTTLPGWGSWGGAGLKKKAPKPQNIKKIAGIDPTQRSDFGKAHVIISEKKDKKAAKYLVKDLPYPYTSKAQFERSLEVPLGAEWNTRVGFQRATLPRVMKKMGTVIDPMEKLF